MEFPFCSECDFVAATPKQFQRHVLQHERVWLKATTESFFDWADEQESAPDFDIDIPFFNEYLEMIGLCRSCSFPQNSECDVINSDSVLEFVPGLFTCVESTLVIKTSKLSPNVINNNQDDNTQVSLQSPLTYDNVSRALSSIEFNPGSLFLAVQPGGILHDPGGGHDFRDDLAVLHDPGGDPCEQNDPGGGQGDPGVRPCNPDDPGSGPRAPDDPGGEPCVQGDPGGGCPRASDPGGGCPRASDPGGGCPRAPDPGGVCPRAPDPGEGCPRVLDAGGGCTRVLDAGGGYTRALELGGGYTRVLEAGGGYTREPDPGGGYTDAHDPGGGYTHVQDQGGGNTLAPDQDLALEKLGGLAFVLEEPGGLELVSEEQGQGLHVLDDHGGSPSVPDKGGGSVPRVLGKGVFPLVHDPGGEVKEEKGSNVPYKLAVSAMVLCKSLLLNWQVFTEGQKTSYFANSRKYLNIM